VDDPTTGRAGAGCRRASRVFSEPSLDGMRPQGAATTAAWPLSVYAETVRAGAIYVAWPFNGLGNGQV